MTAANNRLAQRGLEQDGLPVESPRRAIDRSRANRLVSRHGVPRTALDRARVSPPRPETGALPADYHYAETQNAYFARHVRAALLGLAGPGFVVSSAVLPRPKSSATPRA